MSTRVVVLLLIRVRGSSLRWIFIFGLRGPPEPLFFPKLRRKKKDRRHGGCTGGSAAGSMKYTSRKIGARNTAKGKFFSFLNRVISHLVREFQIFFLRWTNGLPDRVHRGRVGGIGGRIGAGLGRVTPGLAGAAWIRWYTRAGDGG